MITLPFFKILVRKKLKKEHLSKIILIKGRLLIIRLSILPQ